MRLALLIALALAASGCVLYVGEDPDHLPDAGTADAWGGPDIDAWPVPDAPPPIPACNAAMSGSCSCGGGEVGVAVPDSAGGDLCLCGGNSFERMHDGMVGRWQGSGSSPWWPNPVPLEFRFHAGGSYGAECRSPDCSALYYGADGDSSERRYALTDLRDDGYGEGWITVHFEDTSGSVTTGTLADVELSADALTLRFTFWPSWLGMIGPFVYDLNRCEG